MRRSPERRLNAEFQNRLNETTDIVAKNLTQSFVNLGHLGLASQTVSELCVDHAEGRFNVAALVVLLKKPLLVEAEVVIPPLPKSSCVAT